MDLNYWKLHPDFLNNNVFDGSYGEKWSLRKVLRRFIWHDRIHAKAMYRMAVKTFGFDVIPNIFKFNIISTASLTTRQDNAYPAL